MFNDHLYLSEVYKLGDPLTARPGCVVFALHVIEDLDTKGLPTTTSPMFKVCTNSVCGPKEITYSDLVKYNTQTLSYVNMGAGTKVEFYPSKDLSGEVKEFSYKANHNNVVHLSSEKFYASGALMNDAAFSARVTSTSATDVSILCFP